jgi:hypothetical protein
VHIVTNTFHTDRSGVEEFLGVAVALMTHKVFPHGMPTTQAETINADQLAFLKDK